jgi:hypothetical protein
VAHGFSRACVNGVTRLLSSLLFAVAFTIAAIFASVAAGVLLVATLACAVPSIRTWRFVARL